MTRNDMAWVYEGVLSVDKAIRENYYPITELNDMIIGKWSLSGLKYIKEKAYQNMNIIYETIEKPYKLKKGRKNENI